MNSSADARTWPDCNAVQNSPGRDFMPKKIHNCWQSCGGAKTMGCRRSPLGVLAARHSSSTDCAGRLRLSPNSGLRDGLGLAALNWRRANGLRKQVLRPLFLLLAFVILAVISVESYSMGRSKHILAIVPRSKPSESRSTHILALVPRPRPANSCAPAPVSTPFAMPPDALALAAMNAMSPDVPAVKQAIELVRHRKVRQATEIEKSVRDPMTQKLIEWVILRSEESGAGFDRYAAFIRDNPEWPSLGLLRRRAEGALWQERRDALTVRRFLDGKPTSAIGRLVLARVLLAEGDHSGAERDARETWRSAELSAKLETELLSAFPDFLTRADHVIRMDRRLAAKDFTAAMRAAVRLGSPSIPIVKACAAVAAKTSKARPLLEKVPSEARQDLGYTLCRIHWLLRNDGVAESTRLMVDVPREAIPVQDTDEWWRERRVLARELLDRGEVQMAYQVVLDAAPPADEYYRAEFHFMAGWIALRFLNDPPTALEHFAHIDDGSTNPIVLARAGYWRGRAAQAAGQVQEARAYYEAAAHNATAYYGQLARAKLGLGDLVLRTPPESDPAHRARILALDVVRAAEMLYSIGERDLAMRFVAALAERSADITTLAASAEVTTRYEDSRATLLIGKAALARGFALDLYAFPIFGVPHYRKIGPDVEPSIVYSVVRTESGFDPRDVSPAKAVGLMQVTPEAGRDTASRFGIAYDWNRLVCDPVYNTQMGAAELAGLLRDYRGSYLLAFAGYNAGRGRVEKWIEQYGDPRDPQVDPIDWVERIPFAETRNYVERVMENLQVYRERFGRSSQSQELLPTNISVDQTSH
jgi:soluble lytic murein transglycosylase